MTEEQKANYTMGLNGRGAQTCDWNHGWLMGGKMAFWGKDLLRPFVRISCLIRSILQATLLPTLKGGAYEWLLLFNILRSLQSSRRLRTDLYADETANPVHEGDCYVKHVTSNGDRLEVRRGGSQMIEI